MKTLRKTMWVTEDGEKFLDVEKARRHEKALALAAWFEAAADASEHETHTRQMFALSLEAFLDRLPDFGLIIACRPKKPEATK